MENCIKDCKDHCTKYDDLNLSEKTLAGTSFNIDDRKILNVMFCKQDQAIEEQLKKRDDNLVNQLVQVLQEQFNHMNAAITLIAKDVLHIKSEVAKVKRNIGAINTRLDRNDKRMQGFEERLRKLEAKERLRK